MDLPTEQLDCTAVISGDRTYTYNTYFTILMRWYIAGHLNPGLIRYIHPRTALYISFLFLLVYLYLFNYLIPS